MELPKNIVQIGKADPTHKIFVEDYVISYMKQWNKHGKRDTGIVLYGKRMAESDCKYYFVYGASYMPGVEARMQYLTDDEKEDAEDIRNKYFAEYELIGWGELRGELPEGFYVCEQNKGVWVKGYACFFEKNDAMLTFLVTEGSRKIESQPTTIHKEEAHATIRESNIDARMEERNRKLEQLRLNQNLQYDKGKMQTETVEIRAKSWKNAAMIMMLAVCVVAGFVLSDAEKRKNLKDVIGVVVTTATREAERFVDKQTEQLKVGNVADEVEQIVAATTTGEEVLSSEMEGEVDKVEAPENDNTDAIGAIATQPEQEIETMPSEVIKEDTGINQDRVNEAGNVEVETEQEVVAKYVSYVIAEGDTLLAICRKECGSESVLEQVCQLNNIENADDIKIGQTILLPE